VPATAGFNAITPSIFSGNLDFKVIEAQAPAECPARTIFSNPCSVKLSTFSLIIFCY